jgi:hypothetical protein
MSENYRFYVAKMLERRAVPANTAELRWQLAELLDVVQHCEAIWALEDRIEKQR